MATFRLYSLLPAVVQLIRIRESQITAFLTDLSMAESVEKEGEWFTSSSTGFNLDVNIISRPRISNHMLFSRFFAYHE